MATINTFYREAVINYDKVCHQNGVSSNMLYSWLFYSFQKYAHNKNKIALIERLDFEDTHRVKVLLNKAFFSTKTDEVRQAKEDFGAIRHDIFEFLDSVKDPYFFILSPFYKSGSGIAYGDTGFIQDNCSGSKNIEIAADYAMHVISKKSLLI